MTTSVELRAAKAEIEMKASAKLDEARANPSIQKDAEAEASRMLADADALEARARLYDDAETRSKALSEADARRPNADRVAKGSEEETRSANFSRYLRGEIDARELRSMNVGTDAKGGFTVPASTLSTVQVAEGEQGPMVDPTFVTLLRTATGAAINYNALDDRAGKGYIIAEGAAASATDITLSQRELGAYKYTSGFVEISNELIQDSNIDVQALVINALRARMDRALNEHFTTGNGTSQPRGILTAIAADSGSFLTTVGATFTADELFKLQHKPTPAYRKNASWMFSDDVLLASRLLKNADGDYIWKAGLADAYAPTILGARYEINPDMTVAAGSIAATYGDHKGYTYRQVRDFSIKRSDELAMKSDMVTFVGFMRADGDLTNPNAVRGLKIKAA